MRRDSESTGRLGVVLRLVAVGVGAGLILSYPAVAPNPYSLSVSIGILNYAVLSTAWNFVGGFTGYISLGHGALVGLGAYGTGLLIVRAGLPSFVALFVAAAIVALLAVPIGFAALRVRGASFVIVSISLVLILLLVFQSWASFTGGSRGLVVPRPFPHLRRAEHHMVFFFLFAGLLAVALMTWWVIDRSHFGLGLKAIREDEDKAQSLGIPTFTFKLVVFVVSAAFSGLAGGLYALWFGDLDPVFQFSGYALEYFKLEYGDTPLHLVATGLLLGVVVTFMPDGVIPALSNLFARFFRRGETSIREVTAAELLKGGGREAGEQDARAGGSISARAAGHGTGQRAGQLRTEATDATEATEVGP